MAAGAPVWANAPLRGDDEIRALGAEPYAWGTSSDAEAIVTQTADPQWATLDPVRFPDLRVLVDGRNSLTGLKLPADVAYRGIGVPSRGRDAAPADPDAASRGPDAAPPGPGLPAA